MKLSNQNLTILAIILAVTFGHYLPDLALQFKIVGDIFMSLLKMLIVPLVFASIIVAVLSLKTVSALKNLGIKTIGYYMMTTTIAVISALIIYNIFNLQPPQVMAETFTTNSTQELSISLFLMNLIPVNIFHSLSSGNIIQLVTFGVVFGVAILHLPKEKKEILENTFIAFNDSMLKIADWVIKLTPIGVFGLISYVIAKNGLETLLDLIGFISMILTALAIHSIIVTPTLLRFLGKTEPLTYFKKVSEPVLLAFSTASSSATLPVTMSTVESKGGVSKSTAGFVLPLGSTINMDGTALYQVLAVMFLATMSGMDLTIGQQILIAVTTIFASIGAAGIPGAGIIMMTMILSSVGIPIENIGVILIVDRILDMFRTATNVWGDMVGAKVLDRIGK